MKEQEDRHLDIALHLFENFLQGFLAYQIIISFQEKFLTKNIQVDDAFITTIFWSAYTKTIISYLTFVTEDKDTINIFYLQNTLRNSSQPKLNSEEAIHIVKKIIKYLNIHDDLHKGLRKIRDKSLAHQDRAIIHNPNILSITNDTTFSNFEKSYSYCLNELVNLMIILDNLDLKPSIELSILKIKKTTYSVFDLIYTT